MKISQEEYNPYCPICSACGEEGCCSAMACQQHPDGDYCAGYLVDLKFSYIMYDYLINLVGEDEKYKEQIDKMWDETYERLYKGQI